MSNKRKTLELASQQFYKFEKWILAESKREKKTLINLCKYDIKEKQN